MRKNDAGYYASSRRLSNRVRWIDHLPVAFTIGDLYLQVDLDNGTRLYARVLRAAKQRAVRYWLSHLLQHVSGAREVTVL